MPDCTEEPALSIAAAELLLQPDAPSSDALTRAVREAGSDAVLVRALLWRDDAPVNRMRDWLAAFAKQADAEIACGVAHGASKHLLLATSRGGALDALSEDSHEVTGRLSPGFVDAELVIADGDGGLQRLAVDAKALARGIPISASLPRPARLQLLARGRHGPRPIAERTLPSRRGARAGEVPANLSAASGNGSATEDLAARLSSLRAAQRRPPLRTNSLLAGVAAAHARRVCASGVVAHELDHHGNPEQRLRDAGVQARRVGETVARAASSEAAFSAFEHSPSHLLTLLERGFTDVGIADEADADGQHCVVVLLAEWPRYVGR